MALYTDNVVVKDKPEFIMKLLKRTNRHMKDYRKEYVSGKKILYR